ncbi:MAG: hypothetical protein ACI88A_004564 [Paraglaciecola sp.]|jgi:hypothetical protein
MQLICLKKVWSKGKHNAFTDLCYFNGKLYCCFREALNHVSADGVVRIVELSAEGRFSASQLIHLHQVDIRDPKLSVTPDGKLLLMAYARHTGENNQTLYSQAVCWNTANGLSWSSHTFFGQKNWWLWRLTWHQGQAYGFAYNRAKQVVDFYQGDPRRTFHVNCKNAFSLISNGKGYPNESDLVFVGDNAYALLRRDADTYSAQLGRAKIPYKNWVWQDLGRYIGGPAMLLIDNNSAIIAGRIEHKNELKTAIMRLDLGSGKLEVSLILPSSGDNSYPGLVIKGNTLLVSYYSCHQDDKSSIYLAKIDLLNDSGREADIRT